MLWLRGLCPRRPNRRQTRRTRLTTLTAHKARTLKRPSFHRPVPLARAGKVARRDAPYARDALLPRPVTLAGARSQRRRTLQPAGVRTVAALTKGGLGSIGSEGGGYLV